MSSTESVLEKNMKHSNLNESNKINILLLGETGIGKSTFINSVANYLTCKNVNEEKEHSQMSLPSTYDFQGNDYVRKIGIDPEHNKYSVRDVLATKHIKTYVIPIWAGDVELCIIDAPGMDNTSTTEQDANLENILSYVGHFSELHAIWFLFKPTKEGTKCIKYYAPLILSSLKTVNQNIIFISSCRGDNMFPLLQKVLNNIKDNPPFIEIPLTKKNTFYNIRMIKQSSESDHSGGEIAIENWKKSVDQCWRLIKYVVGDARNLPLTPHVIQCSLIDSIRVIRQLSQPLVDILQLINDNIVALLTQEQCLDKKSSFFKIFLKSSLDELSKELYVPIINLDVIKLEEPATVCVSSRCAEIYMVGNLNKWSNKRCHDRCYLTNDPKEIIGSPELVECEEMDSTKKCKKCRCDLSTHMHVYYMTKTVEHRKIDSNMQKDCSKDYVLQRARKVKDDICARKAELEVEFNAVLKCTAEFMQFLQKNAVNENIDIYEKYIDFLIKREISMRSSVLANPAKELQLRKSLRVYGEQKIFNDVSLKFQETLSGNSNACVNPQEIHERVQTLFKMNLNGEKLRELYESQEQVRSKEFERTKYIHKAVQSTDFVSRGNKMKNEKESDTQRKHKQFLKNQVKRGNKNEYQQRERTRSPPPTYDHVAYPPHHVNPYANYSAAGQSYQNRPPPASTPTSYGTNPFSYDTPNTSYETRGDSTTYEFNISLNKRSQPRQPRTSNYYYGHSYPHSGHPPPPPSYYSPHGPYPPQHETYPPPPPGTYPSYASPHDPYPHSTRPHYNAHLRHDNGTQHAELSRGNRGRGRGRGTRGARGRDGVIKSQKFRPSKKRGKRDEGSDESGDSDSDTSYASSAK